MSMLIKGMEMPSDGTYTMNVHVVDGKAIVRKLDKNSLGAYEMIEIPTPHGRLIDADAFFEDICNDINAMTKIGIVVDGDWLWGKLNDALGHAQAVIEAEE